MFDRKKTSTLTPKRRWFFKVENVDDAEEAIQLCYQIFYVLGAIIAVVIGSLAFYGITSYANLLDPVFMILFARIIQQKKSRTAAVLIVIYAIYISILTLANKAGIQLQTDTLGGRNIVLSAIAIYGSYKGLQGTFNYHKMNDHTVLWENVFIVSGLFVLYNVIVFVILIMISVYFPPLQFIGEVDDDIGPVVLMFLFLLVTAATAFRVLPGMKNAPLVEVRETEGSTA